MSNVKTDAAKQASSTSMTFADAAERVLRDNGSEMQNSALAKAAIQKGYLVTQSSRPETSMHVSLRSDNRAREKRGMRGRFVFKPGGKVSLAEWQTGDEYDRLVEAARKTRERVAKNLIDGLIRHNNGSDFEKFVGDLLVQAGYENVEVIGGSDDQGVDIVCEETQGMLARRLAVQCKCKKRTNKIGPKDVSTLRDNLSTYQADAGIIVTTSEPNADARKKATEAGKERIHFIEGRKLADLCLQHSVGIRSQSVDVYDLDHDTYGYLKASSDGGKPARRRRAKKAGK